MAESSSRLDFSNLPLVEAAARFTLSNPVRLSYSIVFAIKEKLSRDFPAMAEPRRIEGPPGIESRIEFRPGDLLGAVFSGNTSGLQITVQSQLLAARWTRGAGPHSSSYPRFEAIREALASGLGAFSEAAGQETFPHVQVANMFYVNFVQLSDRRGALERYLSPLAHPELLRSARAVQKLEASWEEVDGVDLRFDFQHAKAEIEEGKSIDGYQLTTAAGRTLESASNPFESLDLLHTRLQHFFRDLISKDAKQEWGLAND